MGDAQGARGPSARVLVVDDDPIVAESLGEYLRAEGFDAAVALDAAEALDVLRSGEAGGGGRRPYDVVLSDVNMPRMSGMDLLDAIGREGIGASVVMLTGYSTVENAVEALRRGAVDYLTKPVVDDELRMGLERALRQRRLVEENRVLRGRLDERFGLGNIVGGDARMKRVYELVQAVAPSRTTVLMSGESGTGKSLIAHAIHHNSPRSGKPFIELSCGSIPETLLESELFGHVRGAYTGAHADKVGRFEAADGGTIFLDEINSASAGMQLKLLRVLQERKFEPVGATETREVDVRVILASNQPLEKLVAAGTFRQDLYYRINVVKIELPPLRDRVSDIPMLAEHFLEKHAREVGKALRGFSAEAMDALRRHSFPGNVRELANIIERAAVLCRGPMIEVHDLPAEMVAGDDRGLLAALAGESGARWRAGGVNGAETGGVTDPSAGTDDEAWTPMALEEALREPEKRILLRALRANQWNRQKTADQLQINRTTLYKKMRLLGIEDGDERRAG